jgi:hypothetical protein
MAAIEPGERPPDPASRSQRQLERPPGERYATRRGGEGADRAGSLGPVLRAALAALLGSLALYAVGGLIASTGGLLFVAGVTGAIVGLLLARAAVPADGGPPALPRRQVTRLAIGLSLAAIAVASVAIWLHAVGEGGTLGFVDYQLETFGPFILGEVVIAVLAAAWGAGAGPIQG